MVQRTLPVILSLSLVACGQDRPTAADHTVRDSSGVRIIEYPSTPAPLYTFALGPEPLYRFGDDEGEYPFQGIPAAALRADGGAVVGTSGKSELIVIAPNGTLERILARSGPGPGEIGSVSSITPLGGDTILIEDDRNARFTKFAGITLIDSRPIGGGFMQMISSGVQGIDDRGRPLMITTAYSPDFEAPWLEGHMVSYDLELGAPDTVAPYDYVRRSPQGQPTNPFPPAGVASVTGGRFVYGRSDIAEIRWLSSDGILQQILRWHTEPRHASQEDIERLEEEIRSIMSRSNPGMAQSEVETLVQQSTANLRLDENEPLPVFGLLRSDGEGGLWIGEFVPARGEPTRYAIIGEDGLWQGTLDVPPDLRILDVRWGLVLGVLKDELDVESVAAFQVIRTPVD